MADHRAPRKRADETAGPGRRLRGLVLLCLCLSEALLVQWLRLAAGQAPLGASGLALALALLASVNLALILSLRTLSRGTPLWFAVSRVLMLVSLGALLTGPLLGASFATTGALLVAVDLLRGPDPRAAAYLVTGGGAAVALGFGCILWGALIGQRRLTVERVDLPVRGLPPALQGLQIAHLSDFHIGPQLRGPRLRGIVDAVNRLQPDLIAITGDIFDFDPSYIDEGTAQLARLEARLGVFAVLGNHDVYTGADAVARALTESTHIRLLRDAWRQIDLGDAVLYMLGIDDPGRRWAGDLGESEALERLAKEVPTDGPRVLLVHRPGYFAQAARLGIPVSLAGHTHGGQVSLPPPAHQYNISRLTTRWTRGLFTDAGSLLYVSRGVGVAGPPVRLNCPREIALLRLVAEN